MAQYNLNFFQYLEAFSRNLKAQPLNLGGIISSGGGGGGPPGGFLGYLPQTRVSYDTDELADDGFVNPGAVDASGVVVSATLLDNLNHIRYRIETLETGTLVVYNEDVLVASGIHILDFKGNVDVVDIDGNEVEITVSGGGGTFTDLSDTPSSYSGESGKYVSVKDTEDGLEFVTISGESHNPLTVGDTPTIDFTITDQYLEADVVVSGVDHDQLLNTHNLTTDIDHTTITNIGSNAHSVIDTHIADTAIHFDEFPELSDTPASYSTFSGYFVQVKDTEDGLQFALGAGGASAFTNLTDVPSSYSGESGKHAVVNTAEDALEFVTISGVALAFETSSESLGIDQDRSTGGSFTYQSQLVWIAHPILLTSVLWDIRIADNYTMTVRDEDETVLATVVVNGVGAASADEEFALDSDIILEPGFYRFRMTPDSSQTWYDVNGNENYYFNQFAIFKDIDYGGTFYTAYRAPLKLKLYDSYTIPSSGYQIPDTFVELTDTPTNYTAASGKYARVNDTEDALIFDDVAAGAVAFTDLTDVPSSYAGEATKVAAVKADETGLEFVVASGAGDTYKSKVSADDTTEDYLENKIVEGAGVTIIVLNEGGDEELQITASGSGASTFNVTASENLTTGNLIDIWNDEGTAKAQQADASNGYLADGFVLSAVTSGNTAVVYLSGQVTDLSGMTPGTRQFLSIDGGRVETAPSVSGYYVQEVGIALSATVLKFEPQQVIMLA